jgi:hypothetical protein
MTGFVLDDKRVWGRPVGVAVAHDGSLLVTEDTGGTCGVSHITAISQEEFFAKGPRWIQDVSLTRSLPNVKRAFQVLYTRNRTFTEVNFRSLR